MCLHCNQVQAIIEQEITSHLSYENTVDSLFKAVKKSRKTCHKLFEISNQNGDTLLHYLVKIVVLTNTQENLVVHKLVIDNLCRLVMEYGASFKVHNTVSGDTPAQFLMNAHPAILLRLQSLLESKEDIFNIKNAQGKTLKNLLLEQKILDKALQTYHLSDVDTLKLLKLGANPFVKKDGLPLLHQHIRNAKDKSTFINALLTCEVDVLALDDTQKTALELGFILLTQKGSHINNVKLVCYHMVKNTFLRDGSNIGLTKLRELSIKYPDVNMYPFQETACAALFDSLEDRNNELPISLEEKCRRLTLAIPMLDYNVRRPHLMVGEVLSVLPIMPVSDSMSKLLNLLNPSPIERIEAKIKELNANVKDFKIDVSEKKEKPIYRWNREKCAARSRELFPVSLQYHVNYGTCEDLEPDSSYKL